MKTMLAENIRAFRKDRSLTQESAYLKTKR